MTQAQPPTRFNGSLLRGIADDFRNERLYQSQCGDCGKIFERHEANHDDAKKHILSIIGLLTRRLRDSD